MWLIHSVCRPCVWPPLRWMKSPDTAGLPNFAASLHLRDLFSVSRPVPATSVHFPCFAPQRSAPPRSAPQRSAFSAAAIRVQPRSTPRPVRLSLGQRSLDGQLSKPAEVAIGRPEPIDPVSNTDGCDSCVMDHRAVDFRLLEQPPLPRRQYHGSWTRKPSGILRRAPRRRHGSPLAQNPLPHLAHRAPCAGLARPDHERLFPFRRPSTLLPQRANRRCLLWSSSIFPILQLGACYCRVKSV